MEYTSLKLATIFKPNEGKTFEFLGNITTCKFNSSNHRGWQFFEFLTTAGFSIPLHSHPWDEITYLLEGEVDFQIEDQMVRATPGYFINLPKGAAHAFNVRSPQAKFLVGVSNEIAAQFVEEMAQAELEQRLTPEMVIAIAQKHRVQIAIG